MLVLLFAVCFAQKDGGYRPVRPNMPPSRTDTAYSAPQDTVTGIQPVQPKPSQSFLQKLDDDIDVFFKKIWDSIVSNFFGFFIDIWNWFSNIRLTKDGSLYPGMTPDKALAQARRASGLANLRNIFTYEMCYYAETGKYSPDMKELGVYVTPKYYKFSIETDGNDKLIVRGEGNIDNDDFIDVIIMDETGQFYIVQDDITNTITDKLDKPPGQGSGMKPAIDK